MLTNGMAASSLTWTAWRGFRGSKRGEPSTPRHGSQGRDLTGDRRDASALPVWHTDLVERTDLLKELRRDRAVDGRPRRRPWRLAFAVLVLLALGVGGWLVAARATVPTVRTALARPAGGEGGAPSVLDASGYVTARRQATVSAKITGKIVEVSIEEGMRVPEG